MSIMGGSRPKDHNDFNLAVDPSEEQTVSERVNSLGKKGLGAIAIGALVSLFIGFKLELPMWSFLSLLLILAAPGAIIFRRSRQLVEGVPSVHQPSDNDVEVAAKPKRDKPKLPQKEPKFKPTGPVPTQGLRGVFWKLIGRHLFARYGWKGLTVRSRSERYHGSLLRQWELRHVQKVIAVLNKKGGSCKTMISVWLAKMFAYALHVAVLALDANENGGNTAKRLGLMREKTLGLRTFLAEPNNYGTLAQLQQDPDENGGGVAWEPETGVMVIAAEISKLAIAIKPYRKGVRVLKRSVHTLVCDLGNGTVHGPNEGSVKEADTLVIVGRKGSGDSLDDITGSIDTYRDMGYGAKLDNAIIVIVGGLFVWRNRKKFAKRYNYPVEQVFVIPWNYYMKSDRPARLNKIPLRVKAALAETAVAILEAKVVKSKESVDGSVQQVTAKRLPQTPETEPVAEIDPQSTPQLPAPSEQPSVPVDSSADAAPAIAPAPTAPVELSNPAPAEPDNPSAETTLDAPGAQGPGQSHEAIAAQIRERAFVSAGVRRPD